MQLRRLSLFNFKNHLQVDLEPDPAYNAFVGDNGEGKTNLLDALHYLALCKSYFNPVDSQNIRDEEDSCMVQGSFEIDGREENIACAIRRQQKKVFRRNGNEYDRLAEHIGLIPVVMIAPTDTRLITDGSEERRRFLDSIIAQYDRTYLDNLVAYNRILTQRNAFLKQSAPGRPDPSMLSILNEQLIPLGSRIHSTRQAFIAELVPVFREHYAFISGGREQTDVLYDSHLNDASFEEALQKAVERDRAAQFTTVGIHKDELDFQIAGKPVKKFASQGQQKSFLTALKLAQFDFMRDVMKVKPLLLLDDIFDKLDDKRVARLMELVSDDHFGQLFITDTHPERIRQIFRSIGRDIRCFMVQDGEVRLINSSNPILHA
ncbi:MAG: DNA replication/repair protein RecF [Bacteroidota bacterium]